MVNPSISADTVVIEPLSGPDFYPKLIEDVIATQAGDRIGATTMSFNPDDPTVNTLICELSDAAARHVDIRLGVDAYTLLLESTTLMPGPLWTPLPFGQNRFHRRKYRLERLGAHAHAAVEIINQPGRRFSNPVAGRSHLKFFVVNNKVYVPNGNLNLTSDRDMTLGFEDAVTADLLYDIASDLTQTRNTRATLGIRDQVHQIDTTTNMLIDAGVPGQSRILDEALRIINEAEQWIVLATQYFPRDAILKPLVKACLNDVDVRLPFNDPLSQGLLEKLPETLAIVRRRKMAATLLTGRLPIGTAKMHLKALANENEALGGNHNYDPRGVKYGTAELAILRRDPVFARLIANFALTQADRPLLEV